MRRVGGLVMLNRSGLPAHLFPTAHLFAAVRERYAHLRTRVQSRALASDSEEGSIAPLIVGMLALLLLIGSATVAITGAYLQTQHLQDMADAQANSITRTIRTPEEASGSAAWEYASAYLAEVQPGQDFQALRLDNVSVDSDQSVHVYLSARIRPPLLSILVPDGIEVTAHGSSRLKTSQGPSSD